MYPFMGLGVTLIITLSLVKFLDNEHETKTYDFQSYLDYTK